MASNAKPIAQPAALARIAPLIAATTSNDATMPNRKKPISGDQRERL
jgi:hypothetical protein